jgi:hypothetical protein
MAVQDSESIDTPIVEIKRRAENGGNAQCFAFTADIITASEGTEDFRQRAQGWLAN